jgi:hypothetical protein
MFKTFDTLKIVNNIDNYLNDILDDYDGYIIKCKYVGLSRVDGGKFINIEINYKKYQRLKKLQNIFNYQEKMEIFSYEDAIIKDIFKLIKKHKIVHVKSIEDYITLFNC